MRVLYVIVGGALAVPLMCNYLTSIKQECPLYYLVISRTELELETTLLEIPLHYYKDIYIVALYAVYLGIGQNHNKKDIILQLLPSFIFPYSSFHQHTDS